MGRPPLRTRVLCGFVAGALVLIPSLVRSGGVGVSEPPEQVSQSQSSSIPFHPYKVPVLTSRLAFRDLEFLWSDNYRALFNRPLDASYGGQTDLERFGITISEVTGTTPFNFLFTDIQLVYNYFNRRFPQYRDSLYNPNPLASIGFKVSQPAYPDDDRKHVDTYIYVPQFATDPLYTQGYGGDDGRNYGAAASFFTDSLTE